MCQVFTSGGQSIGVSASASVLLMNVQDWFPLGLTGLISLVSKGPSSLLQHHGSLVLSFLYSPNSHFHTWLLEKPLTLTKWTFVGKVMLTSLLFNMLSRLVIAFLPRSKCLLISWLQSLSAVFWSPPPQIKSVTVTIVYPSICYEVMVPDAMILVFWMLSFK